MGYEVLRGRLGGAVHLAQKTLGDRSLTCVVPCILSFAFLLEVAR